MAAPHPIDLGPVEWVLRLPEVSPSHARRIVAKYATAQVRIGQARDAIDALRRDMRVIQREAERFARESGWSPEEIAVAKASPLSDRERQELLAETLASLSHGEFR